MTNFPPKVLPLLARRWYEDESRGVLCDTPGVNFTPLGNRSENRDTGTPKRDLNDGRILTRDDIFLLGTKSSHHKVLKVSDLGDRPPGEWALVIYHSTA